jgi:hypothetical protein
VTKLAILAVDDDPAVPSNVEVPQSVYLARRYLATI